MDAYGNYGRVRQLTIAECVDLMALVCKLFSVVYIVIDAVDECDDAVSKNLFEYIQVLQRAGNVRLMLTSRFIPSIIEMVEEELGKCPQLEVRASDNDIRNYFANRQLGFTGFLKTNHDLCIAACEKVVEASEGM